MDVSDRKYGKKLVWYWPNMLDLQANWTEKTKWHTAIGMVTKKRVCLIDRTDLSKKYGDGLDTAYVEDKILKYDPTVLDLFNGKYWYENFPELMLKISNQILDNAAKYNELRLSYSGGTDSLTAFVALLSNPRIKPWLDSRKFVIYTTSTANFEDPAAWDKILRLNLPLKLLDYNTLNSDDSNYYMVTGDGDTHGTWWLTLHTDSRGPTRFTYDEIFNSSLNNIKNKFEKWVLTRDPSGIFLDYFRALIKLSDAPLNNLHQAWVWLESNIGDQCYIFRPTAYAEDNTVHLTPRDNWFWFFANKDMADKCAYERHHNIYKSDETLKFRCLEYISKWMGYPGIKTKRKLYSQIKIPKIIHKTQIFDDYTFNTTLKL